MPNPNLGPFRIARAVHFGASKLVLIFTLSAVPSVGFTASVFFYGSDQHAKYVGCTLDIYFSGVLAVAGFSPQSVTNRVAATMAKNDCSGDPFFPGLHNYCSISFTVSGTPLGDLTSLVIHRADGAEETYETADMDQRCNENGPSFIRKSWWTQLAWDLAAA